MSYQADHEWVAGVHLPALAAGVVIPAARLSTCEHCHTLRVVDEGTGAETFLRRSKNEAERVSEVAPACVSPSPFLRGWDGEVAPPLLRQAFRARARRYLSRPGSVAPLAAAPVRQLGLW